MSLVQFSLRRKLFQILELCFMEVKLIAIGSAQPTTGDAFFLTFRQKYLSVHDNIVSQMALI